MDMGVAEAAIADWIAPISRQIWDVKYRFEALDGTPLHEVLADLRFLPGGRTLSGAGTTRLKGKQLAPRGPSNNPLAPMREAGWLSCMRRGWSKWS